MMRIDRVYPNGKPIKKPTFQEPHPLEVIGFFNLIDFIMIEFLKESDSFAGITFSGMFNINLSHLEILYQHYEETGENLLDDYVEVIHLGWDDQLNYRYLDAEMLTQKLQSISNIRKLRIFEPEYIYELQGYCRGCYKRFQNRNNRKVSRKRNRASAFTSKTYVREKIFDKYGEKCLNCGSTDNICLDHVKPISRDGKNEISNLQPLCKSCNSSKGTKIIDYR